MQTLLRKWWVILLQGILLIILGFYILNHPEATLVSLAFWMSIFILGTGVVGIIGWLMAEKDQRDKFDLIWSMASALFGIILLAKIGFAMKFLTTILGIWMIIAGGGLTEQAWVIRKGNSISWFIIALGIASVIAGIAIIFSLNAGAIAVSTIVSLQLFAVGLGLIVLAFLKKKVVSLVKSGMGKLGS
jgi:uncharacterized membrane protein HdeD (DUF308 family)